MAEREHLLLARGIYSWKKPKHMFRHKSPSEGQSIWDSIWCLRVIGGGKGAVLPPPAQERDVVELGSLLFMPHGLCFKQQQGCGSGCTAVPKSVSAFFKACLRCRLLT